MKNNFVVLYKAVYVFGNQTNITNILYSMNKFFYKCTMGSS